jgi:uncharacterized damage-inducible protein DinB
VDYREFLIRPIAYLAPDKILEGLDSELAERRAAGAPHSIAEVVAHLAFWQDWFAGRIHGGATPMPESAALGWPSVAPGEWPAVRKRFLDRLRELAQLSDQDGNRPLSPPIEFPPMARYTVGDALVHIATHNSHHLGQVILLRQLQGAWPPPAGSWTW